MNNIDKSELNNFFVETFNSILAKEEKRDIIILLWKEVIY